MKFALKNKFEQVSFYVSKSKFEEAMNYGFLYCPDTNTYYISDIISGEGVKNG